MTQPNPYQFTSLEAVPLQNILDAFNRAFVDYFVPIDFTLDQFRLKIDLEDIQLKYSVGCFIHGQLIGFILHGKRKLAGKTILYNAGTGLLPEYRNKKLVRHMYNYFLTQPLTAGINKIELEVITENIQAIRAYEHVGFLKKEIAIYYKIPVADKSNLINHQIFECLDDLCIDKREFWFKRPFWQNDLLGKYRDYPFYKCIAARSNNKITGYAIINTDNHRIVQIATHKNYRRQGIASGLLDYLGKNYAHKLYFINVSEKNTKLIYFLVNQGAQVYLRQYKMELVIKN